MQTQATVLHHPAAQKRAPAKARASGVWAEPILALALIAAGTVALIAAMLITVIGAPFLAGFIAWLALRSRDGARAKRRLARARRRARARGLAVL